MAKKTEAVTQENTETTTSEATATQGNQRQNRTPAQIEQYRKRQAQYYKERRRNITNYLKQDFRSGADIVRQQDFARLTNILLQNLPQLRNVSIFIADRETTRDLNVIRRLSDTANRINDALTYTNINDASEVIEMSKEIKEIQAQISSQIQEYAKKIDTLSQKIGKLGA
ncbi:hypothetical protein CQA49_06810 [Helicobacter sp. MIT 00-7814]|uniref:hypothetical protein n=1 Tax=unclassified Helicobacter TaxID=2593540 RepID=UPI000E1FAE93|nr:MULTISPECIES: hypothetical protein [unclassified Helicobacter]RDU53352.1 hypothetical protein CQA49_06810 [Helicobacter sp. MIT 00-7814]RDU54173.1 hypothetical protein CQA37_06050 [Helicobacter sp. MIT 99-10781]